MKRLFATLIVSSLVLVGCQGQDSANAPTNTQAEGNIEKTILPDPSIKGPTEPPNMKGPDGPPPGSEDDASVQAMTETETVEYSLPESSEVEFKVQ